MIIHTFNGLVTAYLDTLRGRASHAVRRREASPWVLTLTTTPTRREILDRHRTKGRGHFQPGATLANSELALIRAACRWGLYHEVWNGGDPTAGIKKWKTARRRRISKFDELRTLLNYFDTATTETELRDRALYGLMLFTGCRPSEARKALWTAIRPYGAMGCWLKGTTKTGEPHELPVPRQAMQWLQAWLAIRPIDALNPYLFPSRKSRGPLTEAGVCRRWITIRGELGLAGLWNYDLRRTLACMMGNELHYDDHTIRAILNHADGTSLSHYYFKSFDSLTEPMQHYADWLCALKEDTTARLREPVQSLSLPIVSLPVPAPPAARDPTQPSPLPPVPLPTRQMVRRPFSGGERQVLPRSAHGAGPLPILHRSCRDL